VRGTLLGSYLVMGKLAGGGMATVYVAFRARLGHVVALKILHPHFQQDENVRSRFVDKASIQANMRHLNIRAVQDILELKEYGKAEPESLENVTVYLSDFVDFPRKSATLEPRVIIDEFNDLFTEFDNIVSLHGCERIKTIGATINTASHMEPLSEPMRINVSEATAALTGGRFLFEERPPVEVKGKGTMRMYYLRTA